jgi:hypothetical protein
MGKYPQTGPAAWSTRRSRGWVSRDQEWTPELGRRCLDDGEMIEAGLELDVRGRWRIILSAEKQGSLAAMRLRALTDDSRASKPPQPVPALPRRNAGVSVLRVRPRPVPRLAACYAPCNGCKKAHGRGKTSFAGTARAASG